MLDGAKEWYNNTLAITKYLIILFIYFKRTGDHFASGDGDKIVKLLSYDDGMCYYNEIGHSGAIVKVKLIKKKH